MDWIQLIFWTGVIFWGWFVADAIRKLRWAQASEEWPTAEGKVVTSKVEDTRTRFGTTHKLDMQFEYTVQDEKYTGRTVTYKPYQHGYSAMRDITKRYPRGKKVRVSYHPQRPSVAVLEPGAASGNTVMASVMAGALALWVFFGGLL